jgi:hypothetical protein
MSALRLQLLIMADHYGLALSLLGVVVCAGLLFFVLVAWADRQARRMGGAMPHLRSVQPCSSGKAGR